MCYNNNVGPCVFGIFVVFSFYKCKEDVVFRLQQENNILKLAAASTLKAEFVR